MRVTENQLRQLVRKEVLLEYGISGKGTDLPTARKVLKQYQEARDAHAAKLAAKGRGGKMFKKDQALYDNGQKMQALAERLVEEFIEPFNALKAQMDAAYGAKDAEKLRDLRQNLWGLMGRVNWDDSFRFFSQRLRIFKLDHGLWNEIAHIRKFAQDTYSNVGKIVKRLERTPEQNAAADRASRRMRAYWGE